MIKVYIASPYTRGDIAKNVKRQMDCVNELINMGYAPFAPLMSHFQHIIHPQPYEKWLELDMEWLEQCDYLLRLPGDSKGADMEVKRAKEIGMPTFYSTNELKEYVRLNL